MKSVLLLLLVLASSVAITTAMRTSSASAADSRAYYERRASKSAYEIAPEEPPVDHHDEEEHHEEHAPILEILETFDNDTDGYLSESEFEVFYTTFFNMSAAPASTGHEGHAHKTAFTSASRYVLTHSGVRLARRMVAAEAQAGAPTAMNQTICPVAHSLFDEHATLDSNGNMTLNETTLSVLVVEMVFQKVIVGCVLPTVPAAVCNTNKKEAWVWATLAAMGVTLLSLFGVILLPIRSAHSNKPLMHVLLGLSSGALWGDALLHLLPHALEPAFFQTEEDSHIRVLRIMLLCIGSIFLSFLIEKGFHFWAERRRAEGKDPKATKPVDEVRLNKEDEHAHDSECSSGEEAHKEQKFHHGPHGGHVHHIQAFGWINLISDAIHNFFDGIGIGVAFMTSNAVGISTTIAVIFHEIPQELGDFALLIKAGFSRKQALLFNLFSGSTSLVGMFIGCGIGSLDYAEPWILSFVAGMFIYVGLADIIPELNHNAKIKSSLFQIGGMLAGLIINAGLVLAELELKKTKC